MLERVTVKDVLSGFGNGYISLPGVSPKGGSCLPTHPEVSINSQQYCVQGRLSNNEVVLMTTGTLIVEVNSRSIDNFTFEYYGNVGVCGDTMYTPDNRESSQLSAVLTSSHDLGDNSGRCVIIIKSDLHTHFSVLFEVLYLSVTDSISIGDKSLPERSRRGDRLLATTSNGELMLSVYAQSYYFRLKYTVLHCDSLPVITNSTYSPPAPWLPGSKVTYSCVRGYQLKDESHPTIECQLNKTSNTSVWTDHHNVQCIPEPRCHSPPLVVNHSTSVRPDNYTAIYNCLEGYTTNISTSERKSVCSSINNETIPWSWSTPQFTCYPVECVDNFHQLGVDNSSAGTRYGVNQTYTYDCMFGYKNYQTETIRCGLDGNWSSSPNCTQIVECNMTGEINNITHGSINPTNHRYYFMDKLYYRCEDGYTRSGDVVCLSNSTWSDTPRCLLITTTTTVSPTSTMQSTKVADRCTDPPTVDNTILITRMPWFINSTAVYVCAEGFTRVAGNNILTCVKGESGPQWADIDMTLICKHYVTVEVMVGVTIPLALLVVIATVGAVVLHFRRQKPASGTQGGPMIPPISLANMEVPEYEQPTAGAPPGGNTNYINVPADRKRQPPDGRVYEGLQMRQSDVNRYEHLEFN